MRRCRCGAPRPQAMTIFGRRHWLVGGGGAAFGQLVGQVQRSENGDALACLDLACRRGWWSSRGRRLATAVCQQRLAAFRAAEHVDLARGWRLRSASSGTRPWPGLRWLPRAGVPASASMRAARGGQTRPQAVALGGDGGQLLFDQCAPVRLSSSMPQHQPVHPFGEFLRAWPCRVPPLPQNSHCRSAMCRTTARTPHALALRLCAPGTRSGRAG